MCFWKIYQFLLCTEGLTSSENHRNRSHWRPTEIGLSPTSARLQLYPTRSQSSWFRISLSKLQNGFLDLYQIQTYYFLIVRVSSICVLFWRSFQRDHRIVGPQENWKRSNNNVAEASRGHRHNAVHWRSVLHAPWAQLQVQRPNHQAAGATQ